jgi:alkyldihydroxyacetonephosphate synthase
MDRSLEAGAVLSHHHGAGIARLPHLPAALGSGHDLLARVKASLDPARTLNPGKLGV